MGKVIRPNRWTKARGARWFPIALVALPLAAFAAVLFFPATDSTPAEAEAAIGFASLQNAPIDSEEAYFPICSGRERVTCVVDGDTIWYRGEKIRLVGFDTPEISSPGCANEAKLGALAAQRLQDLLNEGAFSLDANPEGRERDRYGRALLVVSRGGANLGEVLVGEGLAKQSNRRWC